MKPDKNCFSKHANKYHKGLKKGESFTTKTRISHIRNELEKFNTEFHQYIFAEFDEKYKKSQSIPQYASSYDPVKGVKRKTTDMIGYDEKTHEWICKLCHIGRLGVSHSKLQGIGQPNLG